MGKKFSIIKEIDLNKLSRQIYEYIHETGIADPYIFMNGETIREMSMDYFETVDVFCERILRNKYPGGRIGAYEGYKVFEDNELEYGEVELR